MSGVFREKNKYHRFVYLKGSPYRGAEVSSQLRSCLHDATIDAAPRIGKYFTEIIVQTVPPQKGEGHKHERVRKI